MWLELYPPAYLFPQVKKKRLVGIVTEPPTAMLGSRGNLVTTSSAFESLDMYLDRLKANNIKE